MILLSLKPFRVIPPSTAEWEPKQAPEKPLHTETATWEQKPTPEKPQHSDMLEVPIVEECDSEQEEFPPPPPPLTIEELSSVQQVGLAKEKQQGKIKIEVSEKLIESFDETNVTIRERTVVQQIGFSDEKRSGIVELVDDAKEDKGKGDSGVKIVDVTDQMEEESPDKTKDVKEFKEAELVKRKTVELPEESILVQQIGFSDEQKSGVVHLIKEGTQKEPPMKKMDESQKMKQKDIKKLKETQLLKMKTVEMPESMSKKVVVQQMGYTDEQQSGVVKIVEPESSADAATLRCAYRKLE